MDPWHASTPPLQTPDGASIGRSIADMRRELDIISARMNALTRLCAQPDLGAQFMIEEGPFTGDPYAALDTTRLWLARARITICSPARQLEQAHIAAGDLATRTRGR